MLQITSDNMLSPSIFPQLILAGNIWLGDNIDSKSPDELAWLKLPGFNTISTILNYNIVPQAERNTGPLC